MVVSVITTTTTAAAETSATPTELRSSHDGRSDAQQNDCPPHIDAFTLR
jgi:hypothetical protein